MKNTRERKNYQLQKDNKQILEAIANHERDNQIKQLVKELSEINQESIDLNQSYFNTLGFTRNIIWRLNEILKDKKELK